MDEPGVNGAEVSLSCTGRSSGVTLLLIPLLIVIIWLLENYLLAGHSRLFWQASPFGLVLYTVLSVIVVGILVPVMRIRSTFLSGAVNMFQIGFRPLRRTLIAVSLTALAGFIIFSLSVQGLDRLAGVALFILLLPTAIAAVMICWVLVGTHVQAYVRSGGAVVSVFTGVLVTALVFAISLSVLFAGVNFREIFTGLFAAGCVTAFCFFAVRDVWATVIIVTFSLMILLNSHIDPAYLASFNLVVAFCGILAVVVLACVHDYFSRHYTTVMLPGK